MVVVLHAAILSLVLISRANRPTSAKPGLVAFDIPAAGKSEPQAPLPPDDARAAVTKAAVLAPSLELTRADVMASLADIVPVVDTTALDAATAIGSGCDLTPQVQDALRHSDAIAHQLPAIPPARRSIANAIVVWNAGWIDSRVGPAQAPLAAIRQMIEQLVATSSAACRNQLQTGPRFVYLPDDAGKTTVLAVGSGEWTWGELSAGALPQAGSIDQLAMAQSSPLWPAARSPVRSPATPQLADRTPDLNALLASLTGRRSAAGTPYNP